MRRSRACLAEPPAESPSTMKSSVSSREAELQSASLPGRRSLRVAVLRAISFSRRRRSRSSARSITHSSSSVRPVRRSGEPMVEGVAHGVLDDADRLDARQAVLGLPDEFRLAQEDREHGAAGGHDVVGGDDGGALVAGQVGVGLEAAEQHVAEPRLVRAALGRRDRVAVGADKTVAGEPGDRPFDRAVAALMLASCRKKSRRRPASRRRATRRDSPSARRGNGMLAFAGVSLFSRISEGAQHQRISTPPKRYAFERAMRNSRSGSKRALGPKICGSGWKRTLVPRRFWISPTSFSLPSGFPRDEGLPVELSIARDLDLKLVGQRVHDGDADAVQAAGGLVDLGIEFSAGVQRRHDDFERRLVAEFRMRIDRDAAAVVGDGQEAVLVELDLDPVGVTGHRLVHGVVDHLGEEVMQAPSRRCRRYTCPAGGGPARAPPAPRCRRRCSSGSGERRCRARSAERAAGAAGSAPRGKRDRRRGPCGSLNSRIGKQVCHVRRQPKFILRSQRIAGESAFPGRRLWPRRTVFVRSAGAGVQREALGTRERVTGVERIALGAASTESPDRFPPLRRRPVSFWPHQGGAGLYRVTGLSGKLLVFSWPAPTFSFDGERPSFRRSCHV